MREHGFIRLSFAAAVKDITAVLFSWDRSKLDGLTPDDRAWRETPDVFWSSRLGRSWSPRMALQLIGTDLCRQHVHPNIWVDRVLAHIHQLDSTAKVIIDDVRFINEITLLREAGAQIVVLQRRADDGSVFPSTDHAYLWEVAPNLPSSPALHASECNWLGVPDIKFLPRIINEGTYQSFYESLNTWYTTFVLNSSSLEVTIV